MKYAYYLKKFWLVYLLTTMVWLLAALAADQAVTTVVQNTPQKRNVTVIIDAGHGGEDGGATSCTGVMESQINLQIALRLRDLCHLLGYKTLMIRSSDISVYTEGNSIATKKLSDLRNRVRIVNDTVDGILISIHQNTFPDSKYSGAQVFYNKVPASTAFAEIMQSSFIAALNTGSNRRCKPAKGIYIMEKIERPAILIECGFISNPEEENKLRSASYQQKISCVISSALYSFLNS